MNGRQNPSYQTLFHNVCQIYEATIMETESAQGVQKNHAYLQMGRQIDQILTEAEQKDPYGARLVSTLCHDLKDKYGRGPSTRTIRYMRKFASLYSEATLHPSLTWSHYCILLSIGDGDTRAALERQAIHLQLGRDALQQLVSHTLQHSSDTPRAFPLSPRKGTMNIARLVRPHPDSAPLLDLGFGVLHVPGTRRLTEFKTGTYLKRSSNGYLTEVECAQGERYCYSAVLESVVDGDTVRLQVQLTSGIFISERFRLRGVDAMEIDTPDGQNAKRALKRLLINRNTLVVHTYHTDRYGRYIADIVADGVYINKTLVEKGHARYLTMHDE